MIDVANKGCKEPVTGVVTSAGKVLGLYPLLSTGLSFAAVQRARHELVATLVGDELAAVEFPIDSDEWRRWMNIHRFLMRHGLLLDDLQQNQRDRTLALVESVLSASGNQEIRGVMQINETIQELTGRLDNEGFPEFGEWMYWISLFGEVSSSEPWGWQLDGHHLNINCLMLGDQIVVTPFFLGSEPLVAESGKYEGVKILRAEEDVALALVGSLNAEQRKKCVTSPSMPNGLFTGAFSDNAIVDYEGIVFGDLSSAQQALCLELIEVYVGRLSDEIATVKMDEVRRHLGETYFSWMGATTAADVFYYRVHSPVILLEFDHEPGIVFKGLEPMKSHVHTMMRTPNGNDYGTDYIRQHRLNHPHHAG
jgi:hypothetical protein